MVKAVYVLCMVSLFRLPDQLVRFDQEQEMYMDSDESSRQSSTPAVPQPGTCKAASHHLAGPNSPVRSAVIWTRTAWPTRRTACSARDPGARSAADRTDRPRCAPLESL